MIVCKKAILRRTTFFETKKLPYQPLELCGCWWEYVGRDRYAL